MYTYCASLNFYASKSRICRRIFWISLSAMTTALMNMHPGDRWRVYLPYQQGYGTTSQTTIPAYSNLIFDIALQSFWHPGEQAGKFKSR